MFMSLCTKMDKHQLSHDHLSPTFSIILQELHAAVAKHIESFTNVLQAVSPEKDSYDEDSYDMDSYDEDSEDEELEAVGVAKKSRKRSRGRRRKLLN